MGPALLTAEHIAAWCNPDQKTFLSSGEAIHAFQTLGPRNRFFQTTRAGGTILDAGAGNGSSLTLRKWLAPKRNDLKMYAWAGLEGAGFSQFDGFEVGFWPHHVPDFDGRSFDAILCANFIEHIDDPLQFVRWAASRLAPGGRLYLEWPRPESINLPTTAALAEHKVLVTTGNYHDDATHRQHPPRAEAVCAVLADAGMSICESGIVSIPAVDQQMAIHARREGNIPAMTMAYWSYTEWCCYFVARKYG